MNLYEEEASLFKEKIKKADSVIQSFSSKQKEVKHSSASLMEGLDQIYAVLIKQMKDKNN
ncbi:hypothetical protein ABFY43_20710 [Bacillus pumilus]|uniref:hypothetical protein n=1 Tax=Bacillus pumilus TaxID=1408 RepID=UPI003D23298D